MSSVVPILPMAQGMGRRNSAVTKFSSVSRRALRWALAFDSRFDQRSPVSRPPFGITGALPW
jgi:hypothetical protein